MRDTLPVLFLHDPIVVPIRKNGTVIGGIDIDSDITNAFDEKDAVFLEKIADDISVFIS